MKISLHVYTYYLYIIVSILSVGFRCCYIINYLFIFSRLIKHWRESEDATVKNVTNIINALTKRCVRKWERNGVELFPRKSVSRRWHSPPHHIPWNKYPSPNWEYNNAHYRHVNYSISFLNFKLQIYKVYGWEKQFIVLMSSIFCQRNSKNSRVKIRYIISKEMLNLKFSINSEFWIKYLKMKGHSLHLGCYYSMLSPCTYY